MIVWILAAASLAPSPGPTEPPTEAAVAVEAEATGSTFVLDGGDLEQGSLERPHEWAAAEVSL